MAQDIEAHHATVREMSKPGGCLAVDAATATVNNPAWFQRSEDKFNVVGERKHLHRKLIEEYLEKASGRRAEHKAIVLAGPPGAGKSTILGDLLSEQQRATYLHIDADDFKRALLVAALADGSYESWIKPAEIKDREATGQRFFPLELASLVHEESSELAKDLRLNEIERGTNIIIDGVLSSERGALELGQQLEAAGYQIRVVDVEVPPEVSEASILSRWQTSYEQALAGQDVLGGRWVPSEYRHDIFEGPQGMSKPEFAAQQLAQQCAAVTNYQVYRLAREDAAAGERTPKLESESRRQQIPDFSPAARAALEASGHTRPFRGQVKEAATPTPPLTAPATHKTTTRQAHPTRTR